MPRLTFQHIVEYADKFGVTVQRKGVGRTIEYWIRGEDHTVGEAETLLEVWEDLHANFFKI